MKEKQLFEEGVEKYFWKSTPGNNCAETAVQVMCDYYGLSKETVLKAAAAFGGGLSGARVSVCGAVSGALMIIGLRTAKEAAVSPTEKGMQLLNYIREKYGSWNCCELLDIDFSDEEQVAREKEQKRRDICTPLLIDVCEWLAKNV